MRRVYIHPWAWAFLAGLLVWTILVASIANSQNLENKRGSTKSAVRDFVKEPSTTYLVDTALSRMVDFAQKTTMLALKEKTKVRQDTLVTSPARVSYYMANTQDAADSVMAGGLAMIILKEATAIGGKEYALAYIPYEMVGKTLSDGGPSFYTVVNRQVILGQSPYGGDTLILFYNVVPRNLDNDTTSLTIAREDQPAVVYMACMISALADHQYQGAQLWWNLWQAHTGFKGYPPNKEEQAPAQ